MATKWVLETAVAFGDVDRENVLTLQGVFKLLQEGAIAHANLYDTGTAAMLTRGESWVLKRMAVEIARYPVYGERVRLETWSTGISGSRGYRDFRVFGSRNTLGGGRPFDPSAGSGSSRAWSRDDSALTQPRSGCFAEGGGTPAPDEPIIRGSSIWVYVSLVAKTVVQVPSDVADGFPSHVQEVYCPGLEDLALPAPDPAESEVIPVSLRYSDFDANDHVNNTAYVDMLQAALAQAERPVRPRSVRIKYGRGIPAGTTGVEVRLAHAAGAAASAFSIGRGSARFAQGEVT